MKRKIRTWSSKMVTKGEKNSEETITMPDLHIDPRKVIENHVRGINPITGAILDNQRYYGNAILPYSKDLTYEELQLKRESLIDQVQNVEQKTNTPGQTSSEPTTDPEPVQKDSGKEPLTT